MPTRKDRNAPVTSEKKSAAARARAERDRLAGLRTKQPREVYLAKRNAYYHSKMVSDPDGMRAKSRLASAKKRTNPKRIQWHKEYNLKRNFGITQEDYDSMLSVVPGCAICGELPVPGGQRLAVDHDHETNRVRGLLCHKCNKGLGLFKDNPKLLLSAVEYLRLPGDNNMTVEIQRTESRAS
jgi:ribosomal protein L24E